MAFARNISIALLCLAAHATGSTWPVPESTSADALPTLEVSLAAPAQPFPQVSAELSSLDMSREAMQSMSVRTAQQSYAAALESAKTEIGSKIGKLMQIFDDPAILKHEAQRREQFASKGTASFLAHRQRVAFPEAKSSVRLNVGRAPPLDGSIIGSIDAMEHKRSEQDKARNEQVAAEMDALTRLVVNELEASINEEVAAALGRGEAQGTSGLSLSNFAEFSQNRLPAQANVRVVAADVPYPTVASLVQDMEARRDVSEQLEAALIFDLELNLVKEEVAVARDTLTSAIERVLAQRSM